MGLGFSIDVGKYIDKVFGWEDDPYGDWKKQQEYNSPVNQLQRLVDAGLNPNLIYGSISNTAGSPIRARQGSNVTASYSPNPPNVDIQKEAIQAQIDLLDEREEGVKLDNDLKRLQVEYFRKNGTAPGVSNVAGIYDRFMNFINEHPGANPMYYVMDFLGSLYGAYETSRNGYPTVKVRKPEEEQEQPYVYSNFSYYGYTPKWRR